MNHKFDNLRLFLGLLIVASFGVRIGVWLNISYDSFVWLQIIVILVCS